MNDGLGGSENLANLNEHRVKGGGNKKSNFSATSFMDEALLNYRSTLEGN